MGGNRLLKQRNWLGDLIDFFELYSLARQHSDRMPVRGVVFCH